MHTNKVTTDVSGFQEYPLQSVQLIRDLGAASVADLIDVVGGASTLLDVVNQFQAGQHTGTPCASIAMMDHCPNLGLVRGPEWRRLATFGGSDHSGAKNERQQCARSESPSNFGKHCMWPFVLGGPRNAVAETGR